MNTSLDRFDALLAASLAAKRETTPKAAKPKRWRPRYKLPPAELRRVVAVTLRVDVFTCPDCGATSHGATELGLSWQAKHASSTKCGWHTCREEEARLLLASGIPFRTNEQQHFDRCPQCWTKRLEVKE